jgi:hypothetical protein
VTAIINPRAAASSTSSPATTASGLHRLPAQLLGRSKNTSKRALTITSTITRSVRASSGRSYLRNWQAALYGGTAHVPVMLVFAASLAKPAPIAYDKGFAKGLTLAVGGKGLRSYPPGHNGGWLYCGQIHQRGARPTICGWADRGTAGLIIFADSKPASRLASQTNQARDAVEA